MKLTLILLAIVTSFSFTKVNELPVRSIYGPTFSASIHNDGDASFMLVIDNPQKERLQLVLRHTQYGVVSDTTISGSKFRCRYNLQTIDDGEYEVEVTNGKEYVVKRFSMQTETKIERKISIAAEPARKRAF